MFFENGRWLYTALIPTIMKKGKEQELFGMRMSYNSYVALLKERTIRRFVDKFGQII